MLARQGFGESAIKRAIRPRLSSTTKNLSAASRTTSRRVATKLLPFVKILDEERVPLATLRRMAWGRWTQDRLIRLALALYLRRDCRGGPGFAADARWNWPGDRVATAAERVFHGSPQFARLVQAGLFVEHGKTPTHDHMLRLTMSLQSSWETITTEVATLDRDAFMRDIARAIATRPRGRGRNRKALTPEQAVIIEALEALQRAVIRGDVTVDELPALRAFATTQRAGGESGTTGAPARTGKKPAQRGRAAVRR